VPVRKWGKSNKRKLDDDDEQSNNFTCVTCKKSFTSEPSLRSHRAKCSSQNGSVKSKTFSYTTLSVNKSMRNSTEQGIWNNASIGESFKYQPVYQQSMVSIVHQLKKSTGNSIDILDGNESDSDDLALSNYHDTFDHE
jgi:hypothetical protein